MTWIIENWADVMVVITSVIAAASAIAALTPTDADNKIIAKIKSFVNLLALNVGGAKVKK